jgi:parallel beta-helix repeat protein
MAHSATYTVSTQGNDSNPGTAQSPWRTIQKAANTAVAGDTVQVQAGTYVERVTFPNSGTASNPITFTGVKGSGGSWDTIIDGSNATSGWVTAPEVGSGVWKATLGYSPQAMMSSGKTIWKISDRAMNGEKLFGTDGDGFHYLARSATAQVTTAFGTVVYWDGIEALFGNRSGTTYLRFRNGDTPANMNVRAAPAGGVLTINGRNNIVIKNFKIVGGQYAVVVAGGGQNNTIDNCYLANGIRRVWVNGARNTVISNSKITMEGLGTENFPPGDRDPSSYPRIVNRHQYDENKFIVGETDTNDASIMVAGGAQDTTITGNEIYNGMLGIQISETTTNTLIINNTIHNFSDTGIYIYPDSASIQATGNLFYDSDHHFRINNMHRDMTVYIYANRFHEPNYNGQGGGGKHVHFSPDTSQTIIAQIWVYHNSFAGGGWACDVGFEGTVPNLSQVHIINNLISTDGLTSGPNPSGWEVTSNYFDKLWYSNTIPDFVLPADHKARSSGIDLSSRGLPGMTAAYYQDGKPDIGAIQGTSQSTLPPPTRLRATIK